MEEKPRRSPRIQLAIPIRVRGISAQHKFFDEETATILVSKNGIMTQIRNLVDLEAEFHVVNLSNEISGTLRAFWVKTQVKDGFNQMGLEVIGVAGNIWGIFFPPENPTIDEPTAQAWLECKNCHQKVLGPIPQAEVEHLVVGVVVARQCDRCRATTTWQLTIEDDHEAPGGEKAPRAKTRAALKLSIKVMREVDGATVEDVCETLNVSRNGAYFLTAKVYQVGESLKIILPYKKGDATRPASAIVTRQDQVEGPFNHAVGIHFETIVQVILPYKKGRQPIPVPARVVRLDQHPGSYVRSVALHMEADKK